MPNLDKIVNWLEHQDEVTVLELLDLKTVDILARFRDVIEERKDILDTEFEEMPFSDDDIEDDEFEGLNVDEFEELPPWEADEE